MRAWLIGILLVVGLHAGTIQNDEAFKSAVMSMGGDNKLILMIYTTEDCPECAYMKQKVFHDKMVEPYLSKNFVVIEKNVHKSKLPDGYDFFGIPTMFFIDKAGNKKETMVGSKRAQPFLKELHRIRGIK
ncbi:MAG: thioredoxin family protein [Sulfuricurvum sp. PD_MW2]|jgi:thioredoxin-related protein|uniref:thioredoxin family protein n=1 Tax=Sulfuricurvum sp. PD_MW2 TaxID=2027917 RepID=UPI000C05E2CA|nr:thioredoxin family protein [Sulfuricurvum sp. PD_MW2]PHM18548.1 MAG: thioredoxin family protein [Sulfuricurvum sp. PD_MW2]